MRHLSSNEEYLQLEVQRLGSLVEARLRAAEGADVAGDAARLRRERDELSGARVAAFERGVTLPLQGLIARFGLNALEVELLLVALAPLLDAALLPAYRKLRGGLFLDGVDVNLALLLAADTWDEKLAARQALAPGAALIAHQILVRSQPRGSANALHHELVLPSRLLHHVLGHDALSETLAPFCSLGRAPVSLDRLILPERLKADLLDVLTPGAALPRALSAWGYDEVLPVGRGVLVLLSGAPGTGKTELARALAAHLDRPLLRVESGKLADSQASVDVLLADLALEVALCDALLFFDDCEALFGTRGGKLTALLELLDRHDGITLLATSHPAELDPALERRIVFHADLPVPGPELREQIWETFLPPGVPLDETVDIPTLANLYDFAGGAIKNAVLVALNRALAADPAKPVVTMQRLCAAADLQLKSRLEELAQATRSPLTLDDLVLPEQQAAEVRAVLNACRSQSLVMNAWGFGQRLTTGKGIVVLFDGPPGTGKTLAAEILASELDRTLFRVNIPAVVSKWVGETEKHIQDVFARARASHAMLLFDEADALFSRRTTEANSSNDRYANMEVNLLLQEIERFDGIVILTTNLYGRLDEALRRRILYRVTFQSPDAAARTRIWRVVLPGRAPLAADLDFDKLGRQYELPGGHIKNAALRAAYKAASDGGAIAMKHVEEAAAEECRAAGIVLRTGEWTSPRTAGAEVEPKRE